MVSYRTGRYANALRWFGMGLRADPSDVDRLDIEVWIEATRQSEGHLEESVAHCRSIVEEAQALHDIAAEAKAIHLLHCGLLALGRPESKDWAGVALPLFEEVGDLRGMAFHLNNLGSEAYWDGNWDLAATRFREGEQLLEKAGSAVEAADLRTNVAEILLDQGHLDEAERLLRESLDTCRAGGNRWGEALALLNLGRLEGRRGEAPAALTTFGRSLEIFREIRQDEKILELEARIAEHELLVPGRASAASRRARRTLRDLARVGDLPPVRVTLERTIGMASASPSAARRHLDAALALGREIDAPYEVALTQLARAPLLPADACAEAREEAEAIFDELGVSEAPSLFR
jgi:tetratricopeptide (TPR) repeat protein